MTSAAHSDRRAAEWAGVALAGALMAPATAHTALWLVPLLSIGWLVHRLRSASPMRAAAVGAVFGTAWVSAGVWWLFVSMHRYGALPAWMAASAVLLLAAVLSVYMGLACMAWARFRRGTTGADALLFAALWLLAEWARGVWFTGFPWAASGYTQVDAPLAGLAPWVGVYGMGAALAFSGAALGLAWPRWRAVEHAQHAGATPGPAPAAAACGRPDVQGTRGTRGTRGMRSMWCLWAGALVAVPLLVPGLLRPLDFTDSAGTSQVTLLQTAVRQDEKFDPTRLPRLLDDLSRALRDSAGTLVVGPETAVPLLPAQLETVVPGWWQGLSEALAASGRTALLWVPLGSFEEGYTNSVVSMGAIAEPYRYDKAHLVPFGEFIPAGFRWFTELMNIPLGDFNRGPLRAPSFTFDGQRLAPNICYEDLFGEELALRFADARLAPTAMVNLSNIAWFGDTIALPQHLHISRLRALEFQRPMLRATNTGATAIVDHRGRVTQALPFHRAGALEGRFDGRTGLTPYAWWASRLGLWPLVAGAALVCLWSVVGGAGSRRRGPPAP